MMRDENLFDYADKMKAHFRMDGAMSDDFTARDGGDYAEKMRRADAAARKSIAAALVVTFFFWGAVFLLQSSSYAISGIPVWFWVCTAGGYVISVAAAWAAAAKI